MSAYSVAVLADAPSCYWKLSESAAPYADTSGVGSTPLGTSATPPTHVAGIVPGDPDGAVLCNPGGGNQYIAAQGSGPAAGLTNVFTLECWVKAAIATPFPDYLTFMDKGGGNFNYRLNPSGFMEIANSGTALIATSTIAITDLLTHHYVWTKNGTVSKMYIDGVDRTGAVTDSVLATNAYWLSVGSGQGGQTLNGTIDEVAIYPTALSAARVLAHYNAGITAVAGGVSLYDQTPAIVSLLL